jgi:hypothetical protein
MKLSDQILDIAVDLTNGISDHYSNTLRDLAFNIKFLEQENTELHRAQIENQATVVNQQRTIEDLQHQVLRMTERIWRLEGR